MPRKPMTFKFDLFSSPRDPGSAQMPQWRTQPIPTRQKIYGEQVTRYLRPRLQSSASAQITSEIAPSARHRASGLADRRWSPITCNHCTRCGATIFVSQVISRQARRRLASSRKRSPISDSPQEP